MSPEPADVQPPARPLPPDGLYFAQIVFWVTVVVMTFTAVWLLPSAPPELAVWKLRLIAVVGAVCVLGGHAVLAMRVIATEPVGRRQLVRSGIELLLAGAALLLLAGLDWLILPTAHFAATKTLPHWLVVVDGLVGTDLLLIGVFASLDGVRTAARTILDEWNRPPPPATPPVTSPRPRVLVDRN